MDDEAHRFVNTVVVCCLLLRLIGFLERFCFPPPRCVHGIYLPKSSFTKLDFFNTAARVLSTCSLARKSLLPPPRYYPPISASPSFANIERGIPHERRSDIYISILPFNARTKCRGGYILM